MYNNLAVYYAWSHTHAWVLRGVQDIGTRGECDVDVRQPGADVSLLGKKPLKTSYSYGVGRGGENEAGHPISPASICYSYTINNDQK